MSVARLVDREPTVDRDQLVASLVPPPRFDAVRFDTYVPDPAEPSQAAALDLAREFALARRESGSRWRFWRRDEDPGRPGLYLDGGFGVGKTHLLASIWHAAESPKAYATFVELTHLTGVLGMAATVQALSDHTLLCIDEFELDDPGDTVLVSTLLGRRADAGLRLAATSNTLPERLGVGRFAAADFRREIQGLSTRFETVRVDGPDYRHRGLPEAPEPLDPADLLAHAQATNGSTLDSFAELRAHLATLHPSRYGRLVDGVAAVHIDGVRRVTDQMVALRLVVLIDRLYDRDVPVACSGEPLDQLFGPDLLAGPYRKKYLRAMSRVMALART